MRAALRVVRRTHDDHPPGVPADRGRRGRRDRPRRAAVARRGAAGASARRTCCAFAPKGQLTLLHMADCHAQLKPLYLSRALRSTSASERRAASSRTSPDRSCSPRFDIAAALARSLHADARPTTRRWPRPTAASAAWIAWRRSSRRSGRSAGAIACCCSTAATPCRAPTRRCRSKGADMVAVLQALGVDATTGPLGVHARAPTASASCSARRAAGLVGPGLPGRQRARHRFRGAGVRRPRACSRRAASTSP